MMLRKSISIGLALSSILFYFSTAHALTVQVLPNQSVLARDTELGLSFTLKTITYSHQYLDVNWTSFKTKNSFKMVFTPKALRNIPLTSDVFAVYSSAQQFAPPTAHDRLVFSSLAMKLAQVAKFSGQTSLVEIFTKLGALPHGQYSYNMNLCSSRGQWVYGVYTVSDLTRIVLAPIGDASSSCYGSCGGECSNWIGSYDDACLSHDLCHRIEGSQLGTCKDEFAYATAAVTVASSCEY